jgi:hypothetical protein
MLEAQEGEMPFVVTAFDTGTPVSREHGSAKAAALDAIALLGKGMSNVVLTDPAGKTYGPGEFTALLIRAPKV